MTYVDDHTAQNAAATAILKANGRIKDGNSSTGTTINNYSLVAVSTNNGIGSAADKVMQMASLVGNGKNVVDVAMPKSSRTDLT